MLIFWIFPVVLSPYSYFWFSIFWKILICKNLFMFWLGMVDWLMVTAKFLVYKLWKVVFEKARNFLTQHTFGKFGTDYMDALFRTWLDLLWFLLTLSPSLTGLFLSENKCKIFFKLVFNVWSEKQNLIKVTLHIY